MASLFGFDLNETIHQWEVHSIGLVNHLYIYIYIIYLYIGKVNRPKKILLEKWKKKSPLLEVRKSPLWK